MADIEFREYRPEDAEGFLRLHDSAFPALSPDFWKDWSHGEVTAAVAVRDGEVVGTVPFAFRDFHLRPDVSVPVAWEYSVCTWPDLRSQGIGSRLMDTAKEFLRGRAQAMMVYRGGERSPGYRFYHRNGHHDLTYLRSYIRKPQPVAGYGAVDKLSYPEFLRQEESAVDIFTNIYGACGGYPRRFCGYYEAAVQTPQYNEVPLALSVFRLPAGGGLLQGYAIAGEEKLSPKVHLLEIATRDNDLSLALPLLAAHADLARERNLPAVAVMPDSSPYVPLLRALDFEQAPRSEQSMMIMAHALDPEGLAKACWRETAATANLEVIAWTPERQVALHHSRDGEGQRITLEMKEETLTRLLCARLDLRAALRQESVTAVGATAAALEAIADALPFSPWAYQQLDFI